MVPLWDQNLSLELRSDGTQDIRMGRGKTEFLTESELG